MTETQITKAEIKARDLAARFDECGFEVKITVTQHEATLYSDGSVMVPAFVTAGVMAHGPSVLDHSYGFSFISHLPAKGFRASTKFSRASDYLGYKPRRGKSIKNLTLRQLWFRLSCEEDAARNRRLHKEAREAGALNCRGCGRVISFNVPGVRWFHVHNDFEKCGYKQVAEPFPSDVKRNTGKSLDELMAAGFTLTVAEGIVFELRKAA